MSTLARKRFLIAVVVVGCLMLALLPFWLTQARRAKELEQVEACEPCLPPGLKLSTEFDPTGGRQRMATTIREQLRLVGAHCENGVILDRYGRQVFFRAIDEGGPAPTKEMEDASRRNYEELRELETKGRVIRMYATQVPR